MTRKLVGRDHRQDPTSGMVRQPVGNSGKIYMQFSQHSTELGRSVNEQLVLPRHMKMKVHAYKSDLLVQPNTRAQISIPDIKEVSKFNERYDPIIVAHDI